MNTNDFFGECLYDFDDIRNRIIPKSIRQEEPPMQRDSLVHIDNPTGDTITVFFADLGVINGISIGFYIHSYHLTAWNISRETFIKNVFSSFRSQ